MRMFLISLSVIGSLGSKSGMKSLIVSVLDDLPRSAFATREQSIALRRSARSSPNGSSV